MATAAVIFCAASRPACAKTRARHEWQAYLDRWWERVEANMPDDTPSLEALTHAVCARRQELTGQITAVLVAQRHAQGLHQRLRPCPHGQRPLPARPAPPRTVHPLGGEVALARPSCDGPDCPQGCAPLDDALQLAERRPPWDLQQAAARRAAAVPCATAQALCTPRPGRPVSDPTSHAVAGERSPQLGGLAGSPTAAEMAPRRAATAAGKTWRPSMVVALDGACVPTRPAQAKGEATGRQRTRARRAGWQGAWQEAQGWRCYLVEPARIVPVVSWSQVARDEAVGPALKRVKDAGLLPADQGRGCVIGEGAKGLGHPVHALLPTAVPSLDSYHCREHGPKVGGRQFSDDAGPAREWLEAMMARRFGGSVAWAIAGLESLQPRDDHTAAELRKLIGFLRHQAGRLHDRTARKGGDPSGRGGLEAANTRSSPVRLKRSGAWW
jgi:hypothetical protein